MGKDRDKGPDTGEDYQFMKETIKKKPLDTRRIFCKVLAIIGGGLLFGISAAVAFYGSSVLTLHFGDREAGKEDIRLITPAPGESDVSGESTSGTHEPEAADKEASAEKEPYTESDSSKEEKEDTSGTVPASGKPLEEYEEIYKQALEVSKEPRKALVTVSAVSDHLDLLDDSILSYGDTEGIIFWESDSDLYILTEGEEIEDADNLQVTFSDYNTARGILCKADSRLGLAVVRVPLESVSKETRESISIAKLGNSYSLQQAKPVIAIGSPTGDKDSVLYGVVIAVSRKLSVADAEFNLMTTDMQGSPHGSGVLLDMDGAVIGVITKLGEGETNIVRALSVTQLRPLLELMSNGGAVKYVGIQGVSITEEQAKGLGIPQGIYVNYVDNDSPAMEAGIQNGDIITAVAGKTVKNMQSYTTSLQQQNAGAKVKLTVARQNGEDGFADMEFEVKIEER
ncbi:S1C family serine protease [Ruminococcus sp. 5_1_39BFAA]|uniref:S1C family serine protease n=1 Tax=Ruminococcus sp. 5_1_39BFAA TaxID=457412 RepID=UPI00356AC948